MLWFVASDCSVFFLFIQTRYIFNVPLGSNVAFAASICLRTSSVITGMRGAQGPRQPAGAKPTFLPCTGGVSHPHGPIFHGRCLHSSWNGIVVKTFGIGNISPRAVRRRIVRYWFPLGCRAIELEKPPQGGCDRSIHRCVRYEQYVR